MSAQWFEHSGDHADIALSTRVRLARNIEGIPFPGRQNKEQAVKAADLLSAPILENKVTASRFTRKEMASLSDTERASLVERHLVSPYFATPAPGGVLLLSSDNGIAIMLNEEDHMRLQVLGTGLCPEACMETAVRLDNMIDEGLTSHGAKYAFSEKLGYLTRCPTNLGTGLRVSVMLHLPLLAAGGQMTALANSAGKLGIAVRGIYGEGTKEHGNLFQISNQSSLGTTEQEQIAKVREVVSGLIERERQARKMALETAPNALEDKVFRAAGLLTSARKMSASEALALLSDYRLGVSLGLIQADIAVLNSLQSQMMPATLSLAVGRTLPAAERDIFRAELIRRVLPKP